MPARPSPVLWTFIMTANASPRAERRKRGRADLAIEHLESPALELTDQMRKGYFGRVRGAREHRFAVEHPSYGDPVQPAGQFAVDPGLDGVSVAETRQFRVGLDHFGGNPRAVGVGARGCARLDDS